MMDNNMIILLCPIYSIVGQYHLSDLYLSALNFHKYAVLLMEIEIVVPVWYRFIKRACQGKALKIIIL